MPMITPPRRKPVPKIATPPSAQHAANRLSTVSLPRLSLSRLNRKATGLASAPSSSASTKAEKSELQGLAQRPTRASAVSNHPYSLQEDMPTPFGSMVSLPSAAGLEYIGCLPSPLPSPCPSPPLIGAQPVALTLSTSSLPPKDLLPSPRNSVCLPPPRPLTNLSQTHSDLSCVRIASIDSNSNYYSFHPTQPSPNLVSIGPSAPVLPKVLVPATTRVRAHLTSSTSTNHIKRHEAASPVLSGPPQPQLRLEPLSPREFPISSIPTPGRLTPWGSTSTSPHLAVPVTANSSGVRFVDSSDSASSENLMCSSPIRSWRTTPSGPSQKERGLNQQQQQLQEQVQGRVDSVAAVDMATLVSLAVSTALNESGGGTQGARPFLPPLTVPTPVVPRPPVPAAQSSQSTQDDLLAAEIAHARAVAYFAERGWAWTPPKTSPVASQDEAEEVMSSPYLTLSFGRRRKVGRTHSRGRSSDQPFFDTSRCAGPSNARRTSEGEGGSAGPQLGRSMSFFRSMHRSPSVRRYRFSLDPKRKDTTPPEPVTVPAATPSASPLAGPHMEQPALNHEPNSSPAAPHMMTVMQSSVLEASAPLPTETGGPLPSSTFNPPPWTRTWLWTQSHAPHNPASGSLRLWSDSVRNFIAPRSRSQGQVEQRSRRWSGLPNPLRTSPLKHSAAPSA